MSATLVLVWLGTTAARVAHEPDLDSWATSRMVGLEEPATDAELAPATHDDATALRVEDLLSEARTAAYSADPSEANARLDDAERLLLDHPRLPEAAWLLAEVWRGRADATRATNPGLATAFERRAIALDGNRALPFGETTAQIRTNKPSVDDTNSHAAIPATPVPLEGPLPSDEVEIDGMRVGYPPTLPIGTHHVRVLRFGRVAWAGWLTADGASAKAPVPTQTPCGTTDLAGVQATKDGVYPGAAVLCPHFAVARVREDGIEVVVCRGTACGTWLPWSRNWGTPFETPVHSPWPAPERKTWILWTAAGVAAVVGGGLLLWREGAFERHGATTETFVWVPPKVP